MTRRAAGAARFHGECDYWVTVCRLDKRRCLDIALAYIDSDLTLLQRRQRKTLAAPCRPMLRRSTTWVISSPQASHLQGGNSGGSFERWSIGNIDSTTETLAIMSH